MEGKYNIPNYLGVILFLYLNIIISPSHQMHLGSTKQAENNLHSKDERDF